MANLSVEKRLLLFDQFSGVEAFDNRSVASEMVQSHKLDWTLVIFQKYDHHECSKWNFDSMVTVENEKGRPVGQGEGLHRIRRLRKWYELAALNQTIV